MFGAATDVTFFYGSIVFGFLLFALQKNMPAQTAFLSILIFNAFGAGPFHQGATWFAFLDKRNRTEFASTRAKRMIFFAGPPLVLAATILATLVHPTLAYGFWLLWSLQHLVQQNVGILLLYHNHGRGEAIVGRALETKSLQMAAITCTLIFFERVLLLGAYKEFIYPLISLIGLYTAWLLANYLVELARQLKSGEYLNGPAFFFWLFSLVSLAPIAFLGKSFEDGYLIPITVHWFQYIALNYVLVKNKYRSEQASNLPPMPPLVLFAAMCTAVTVLMLGISFAKVTFAADPLMQRVLMGVVLGMGNVHYFLDAFLWRFREPYQRQAILPYLLTERQLAQAPPVVSS